MDSILSETLKEFIPENGVYKYFVNGIWETSTSKKTITVTSPIDGIRIGEIQAISTDEAKKAIENAAYAFTGWSQEPMDKRAKLLERAAQVIAENAEIMINLLVWEIGKPYADARDEVLRTVSLIQYYAQEGRRIQNDTLYSDSFPDTGKGKIAITKRVPLGVVLAIPPFNYPINEGAPKLVGALIAGNTVVYKPSTQGAISSLYMVECFRLAGIPAGVLNTVTGRSSEIGDTLVMHPSIQAINITGSTKTAESIKSKMGIIPLIAGLGGKDASIVLDDANLDIAIPEIAKGAFSYSGQRCTGIKRVLLTPGIAEKFLERFIAYVKTTYILGDPRDKSITQGPVINMDTVELVDSLIDDAVQKGGSIILGGKNSQFENRLYYPSTIIDHVTEDMRLAWEEPFGPVLPIMRVKDKEDAIRIANASEYGLQSSIFTQDITDAFYIAEKLDVGTVQINGKDARGPDHFPFIGVKASGLGQVQGAKYLIEVMTRIKTIVINKNF